MADQHDFEKSRPYDSVKGCSRGFHKRSGYSTRKGTYVPPRCIRSTSPYAESSRDFKLGENRRMTQRLRRTKPKGATRCPSGYILRDAYVRRYTTAVRTKGYSVKKKSGTTYKVLPHATSYYVPAACIIDKGKKGEGVPGGKGIAPLRKGELTKFGYTTRLPGEERHKAIEKAVSEYGALSIYRKLNAVAKLSLRVAPEASKVFKTDRDWVVKTYGPLKAF
jgi:hypothetical protein